MVDNNENVLVDFDYNNITIVDPNKTIDNNGKVKERYVKQENLVFYANIECSVLPRTKLAIGVANNDTIRTIAVTDIDFLNIGKKDFLDNSYTDELSGKDSLNGMGDNQTKEDKIPNKNNPKDSYIKQTILTGGKQGAKDNGLLGITNINVRQGLDFLPTISVTLQDIKGRVLFESGDNSPYAAFFNLPYPLFKLTLKGYYGKAIKLGLMLQTFNSRYDTYTGNFKIELKFFTYKYTVLNEISMGYLLAVPQMYRSRVQIQPIKGSENTNFENVEDVTVSRGYQKIKELYSEYKSKGLIPNDFPEITIPQMRQRLENFLTNELDNFIKQNLKPLDDVNTYANILKDYRGNIYSYETTPSWFYKYMDTKNAIVLKNGLEIYTFKTNISETDKNTARTNLVTQINDYNNQLNLNETVGSKGSYTINNKPTYINNSSTIEYNTFIPPKFSIDDVSFEETYKKNKSTNVIPSGDTFNNYKIQISNLINSGLTENFIINGVKTDLNNFFYFYSPNVIQVQDKVNSLPIVGTNSFLDNINLLNKNLKGYSEKIESELTEALSNLIQNNKTEIGFIPNIRNVLAVLFASGEAFLRLMDDVHTIAWKTNDNKAALQIRKSAILNPETANATQDNVSPDLNNNIPIYPWPQMIKQTDGANKDEIYKIVYPGDFTYINETKAYIPEYWPEVEFVEEFISGIVRKDDTIPEVKPIFNEQTEPQRITLNAIEFPISNEVFANKEEVKFFYEIYERLMFISYYSRLIRSNNFIADSDKVSNIIADAESENILKSLYVDNPFLIKKLKEGTFNSNNYENFLMNISNEGVGINWQNYIRGIFNTPYIKNKINNSNFEFINQKIITNSLSQPLVSLPTESIFNNYISGSTTSNEYDFADTYPFTNGNWCKNYLAGGVKIFNEKSAFDTTKILNYNSTNKIITNINSYDSGKQPFTQFLWENSIKPTNYTTDNTSLITFYTNRALNYKNQLITEGNLKYVNYSGNVVANQTVSMLNTPYFVNSIQKGVKNFRNYEKYPFVEAAYLFLNSLPLATLREKYRTKNDSDDLNYIFATLKKFGAIHKIPYAWILKYGSIWHRYKKYTEQNIDIMDGVWEKFNYVNNFDPVTNNINKKYSFDAGGNVGVVDMILQERVIVGSLTSDTINAGFYPKVINDFNVFYQGFEIFSGYTSSDFEEAIKSGFTLNYVNNAIISKENFDPKLPGRELRIFPWSVYINTFDKTSTFIIPSQGSFINQTYNECFKNDKIDIEVMNNQSLYDGSIRTFWCAPNYGYFDSSKVLKPSPLEYIKEILSGQSQQENFSINGNNNGYTEISEMFSVFEKNVLDLFETEFLNFSKSKYDYSYENVAANDTQTSKDFKNFQLLMTQLMKVDKLEGNDGYLIVDDAQTKQYKKIITTLTNFLTSETLIVKFGNPSQFEKRLFYSFSNNTIVEPYTWGEYKLSTPNSVPTINGITLAASKAQYPLEWKALETYVGFSEIPELIYDNNGSYITDFFIDMNVDFTVNSITNFAPIIKIYATQKLNDSTLNKTKFLSLMDDYIQTTENLKNRILNNLMPKVQKKLPDVGNTVQGKLTTDLPNGTQSKVDLWESFKALNDKWISGNDFKTKTLFEDVLLLDRASRNVGEKVLVDIEKLKNLLSTINPKTSLLVFIQSILVDNNFIVMNLPSYVNFYNVQDVVKNAIPKSEGTSEFANSLFGTFLNVDYRNSSAKMVCFFGGKPSEQLDLKNNVDYRYKSDSFELTRPSDNPVVEDLSNKNDYALSNKVVGFNVDIGPQNQSIFYGFAVSQDNGKATAESLEVIYQMASQAGNRAVTTQNMSLYNLYKNRSYKCAVSMMGNAMIQPTMYFNLRYVPMFNGPYMITNVNHNITPGNFETSIEGIRQPIASLDKLDNFLQNIKANLKSSIKNIIETKSVQKERAQTDSNSNSDVIKQKTGVYYILMDKQSTVYNNAESEICKGNLLDYYTNKKYVSYTSPSATTATYDEIKNIINNATTDVNLRTIVFCAIYLQTDDNGNGFRAIQNNFGGISISKNTQTTEWGPVGDKYFEKNYYCSTANVPYVTFSNKNNSVSFLVERWSKRVKDVELTKESITKFLILNNNTTVVRKDNIYTEFDSVQKSLIQDKVQKGLDLYNQLMKLKP